MYTYESPKPPSGLSMDQFDYVLPEDRIGQEPAEPRDSARLLVSLSDAEEPQHRHVYDLPDFVRPGDVIVLNETRVIPARILLTKPTGGIVEVMLVDVLDDGSNGADRTWKALVRPSRKVKVGSQFLAGGGTIVEVGESIDGGQRTVKLRNATTSVVFNEAEELLALEGIGRAPLPPYITTPLANASRYQTTFARVPGSSAAPTAGLHLTEAVLDACVANGAVLHRVELCVGLDTFRPVSVDRPEDHEIHSERFRVPVETLEACRAAKARGGRVIAVGTTAVRALESAAVAAETSGRTKLFIYGDYNFALVDILLTNFHLPRSSLLLLVDAFAGPRWRALYELAKLEEYRFLSFGDAMLLGRKASGAPKHQSLRVQPVT
jgi:S-adenosylmethionine:tRNA ribosyltransferase-isomerase